MIINFHPKEIPSKTGASLINQLATESSDTVAHVADKTVEEWQAIIKSEEKMTFVGPMYWWGLGYEMDKWIQGVFGYNFAFSFDTGTPQGLLAGRQFYMHITHGTPTEQAKPQIDNITERLTKGIFGYCDSKIDITFHQEIRG